MTQCDWEYFDKLCDCSFGIWKVEINADNWKKSAFTCPLSNFIYFYLINQFYRLDRTLIKKDSTSR